MANVANKRRISASYPLLLCFVFLLAALDVFGQVTISNSGGGRLIITGGSIQPAPRTMPRGPATPDAFDSMVASAASFDMDSPVEAHAEFDPPEAPVGSRVIYRLEVTALDESLHVPEELPTPQGLSLHAGGRGQTFQATGVMKLRPLTTVIFRTTVTNTGTFTMPAFEVTAYGKTVKVPEASLRVVPTGTVSESEPPRLVLDLPPGDYYVGQLLRVPLVLPRQENDRVMGLSQPHITGDFIFSEQFSLGMRQETIERDGKTIPAFIEDVMITPLRAGEQELVGQSHAYVLRQIPGQPNGFRSTTMLIDSEPVTLNVKPLPAEGVLPGFTGAVGVLQIEEPRLSAREVRAGEPLTLTLIIHGDGNIGRLTPPSLPKLTDWQGFPPASETASPMAIQNRGFASFDYTLIPLSTSVTATPAIPFSYFDPNKKSYVDLTIPSVPIKVNPGAAGTSAQAPPPEAVTANADQDDPTLREKEPVLSGLAKSPGATTGTLVPLEQRRWFWALQVLPAAALGGLWSWDRRRRYLEQHPEVVLKRRARRGLRRQLRLARRAVDAGDAAGFAIAGASAFRQVCSAQNAANPDALVCADILVELPPTEQEGRTGEMIRRVFAEADAIRFGGAMNEGTQLLTLQPDLEQTLEELKEKLC